MQQDKILKGIHFSSRQIKLAEIKAAKLGISFSEWVKYIVNKEIELLSEADEEWLEFNEPNTAENSEIQSELTSQTQNNEVEDINPDDLPY